MRLFENQRYANLAFRLRDDYGAAEPFPHAVIDDFLPVELAERILDAFPRPEQLDWNRFDKHHSKKLATRIDPNLPGLLYDVLSHFNSAACLRFLEGLTGIEIGKAFVWNREG